MPRVFFVTVGLASEFVGFFCKAISKGFGDFKTFVFSHSMLGDEFRKEAAVNSSRHIVSRRNRKESPGVIVKSNGIVYAGSLYCLFAVSAHTLRAVVKPPSWSEFQYRVVTSERCQFSTVGGLVQCEENDREVGFISISIKSWF